MFRMGEVMLKKDVRCDYIEQCKCTESSDSIGYLYYDLRSDSNIDILYFQRGSNTKTTP